MASNLRRKKGEKIGVVAMNVKRCTALLDLGRGWRGGGARGVKIIFCGLSFGIHFESLQGCEKINARGRRT